MRFFLVFAKDGAPTTRNTTGREQGIVAAAAAEFYQMPNSKYTTASKNKTSSASVERGCVVC